MKTILRSLIFGILLFCYLAPSSTAQEWKRKRFESVIGFGPSQFFGDVGGYSEGNNAGGLRDVSVPQARFDMDFSLKYRITPRLNARFSMTFGYLHASDSRGSNKARGFDASTSIFEPILIGEYYFIKDISESNYMFQDGQGSFSRFLDALSYYAFTGIGGLNYSVVGNSRLENAGMKNSGFTTVIPLGIGTTLEFSPVFNFGIEASGRYSFSDYLDGYSSPTSSANDIYFFLNFTITYKLNTGTSGLPSFR
jgi:hypothetical protein